MYNQTQASFDNLQTNTLTLKMRPVADAIYKQIYPGALIERLKPVNGQPNFLDQELGIDLKIHLLCGAWLSVQEKIRSFEHFQKYGDFTQEYKNAVGTPYEKPGEWFKLGAQLYFYAWANQDETRFAKWVLMDITRYKLLVEGVGGLDQIGELQKNSRHGKATFYGIKLPKLADTFLHTNETFVPHELPQNQTIATPVYAPPLARKGRRIHDLNEFQELWPAVLMRVKKKIGITAAAYLSDAKPAEFDDCDAILEFKKEFHYAKACDAAKRLPFEQVLNECMAAPHRLIFRLAPPAEAPAVIEEAPAPCEDDADEFDTDIHAYAKELFAAEIVGRSGVVEEVTAQ